jgi:hypothetical protein
LPADDPSRCRSASETLVDSHCAVCARSPKRSAHTWVFTYDGHLTDDYPGFPAASRGNRWRAFCSSCLEWKMAVTPKAHVIVWRCSHYFPPTEKRAKHRRCSKPASIVFCRREGSGAAFESRCPTHAKHYGGVEYEPVAVADFDEYLKARRVARALTKPE